MEFIKYSYRFLLTTSIKSIMKERVNKFINFNRFQFKSIYLQEFGMGLTCFVIRGSFLGHPVPCSLNIGENKFLIINPCIKQHCSDN